MKAHLCIPLAVLAAVGIPFPLHSAFAQSRISVPPQLSSQAPQPKPLSLSITNDNGLILIKNPYNKIEYQAVIDDPAVEIVIDKVPDKSVVHLALRNNKKKTLWKTTLTIPESKQLTFQAFGTDGFNLSLKARTTPLKDDAGGQGVAVLDRYNVVTSFRYQSASESLRSERNEEGFVITQIADGKTIREDTIPVPGLAAIYSKKFTDESSTSAATLAKRKVETLQIDNRNGFVSIYQDGVSRFRKQLTGSDLMLEMEKQPGGKFAILTFRDEQKNKLWETRIGSGDGGADLALEAPTSNGIAITMIPRNVASSASPRTSKVLFVLGKDNTISLLEATRTFENAPTLRTRRERHGDQYHISELENDKLVKEYDVPVPKP